MHWFFFFLFLSKSTRRRVTLPRDWPTHRESFHVVSQQQKKKENLFRVFFFSLSFWLPFFFFWRGLVNQPTVRNLVRSCEIIFFSSCLFGFFGWENLKKEKKRKEKPVSCCTCTSRRGGRWEESYDFNHHHRWSLVSCK